MIEITIDEQLNVPNVTLTEQDVQEVSDILSFLNQTPTTIQAATIYHEERIYGMVSYYFAFVTNEGIFKFRQTDGNWSPLLTKQGVFQS